MSALGQKRTLRSYLGQVRFTPKSGHPRAGSRCLPCAKSGPPAAHWARSVSLPW